MTGHIAPVDLRRFVHGELRQDEGARIARHLDKCPRCSMASESMDPLAHAFASVIEPEPPSELIERVLREVEGHSSDLWLPIAVGGTMLGLATLLSIGFDPIASITRVGALLGALGTASAQLTMLAGTTSSLMVLVMAGTILLGSAVATRGFVGRGP